MRKHSRQAPMKGVVTIGAHSGLRKLMRAARRDKLPPERAGLIKRAEESAKKRRSVYLSSAARGMEALVAVIRMRRASGR